MRFVVGITDQIFGVSVEGAQDFKDILVKSLVRRLSFVIVAFLDSSPPRTTNFFIFLFLKF